MAEVISPGNSRWEKFADTLVEAIYTRDGSGGCDSECNHNFSSTRKILAEMGDVDIEASIKFFEENGGFCDCEILLNVDPGPEEDFEEESEV